MLKLIVKYCDGEDADRFSIVNKTWVRDDGERSILHIHGYNSVNLRLGYSLLEIRSPQEVLGDDEN